MKEIQIYTMDAFTDQLFKGNPAGVVVHAEGLSEDQMLLLAREINLSETAFLVKQSDGNYRVRYFTPTKEIDFCGHATIASAWALLTECKLLNQLTELVFETNIGRVPLTWEFDGQDLKSVIMTQVEPKVKECQDEVSLLLGLLGITESDLDLRYKIKLAYTGNWHLLVPIKNKQIIDQMLPDFKRLGEHNRQNKISTTHVYTFNTDSSEYLLYTRDFAPAVGIDEDPVTGSANGALAGYLVFDGIIDATNSFKIIQTNKLNRTGELIVKTSLVHNRIKVQVGGKAVKVFEGKIRIE